MATGPDIKGSNPTATRQPIKYYGFIMYWFHSKLMCLSKPVEVTDNSDKALTYYGICPLTVHY
jgi:hypothetical protein